MTYNVFSGTLNPTHSLTHSLPIIAICINVIAIVERFRDITNHFYKVRDVVTACDLHKSSSFDTTVDITDVVLHFSNVIPSYMVSDSLVKKS